jgi:site-specific DNA recombinase
VSVLVQPRRAFAAAGIPRDGGMADLLTEAKAPMPRFAAVVREDIERSARDTFNALKLEKELTAQGIPLFATDEPANIEGINSTTVVVRRVKQGVAEWFRIQLKEKAWKGLKEHSIDGWNIGPAPYGYQPERVPHPVPAKAAQNQTKTRLVPDPVRGPIVTLIYHWRAEARLSVPTITARLNADPDRYPSPSDRGGWTEQGVGQMLANPKYTGYMVLGRTRKIGGKTRHMPPDQWIWSPKPTHVALVDKATWDAAQRVGAERGNTRDPEMPTTQPGRRYILRSRIRSRIRCRICQRRMCGTTSTAPSYYKTDPGNTYTYYRCPHTRANPRHVAAHPDHPPVGVREDTLLSALAGFFTERVFGPDRATMLTTQLPASAADEAARRQAHAEGLRKQLARIDTAEHALITELEAPVDPGDPPPRPSGAGSAPGSPSCTPNGPGSRPS